jgi:hypothetical protein
VNGTIQFENRLLGQMSLGRMAWVSLAFVLQNLPLVLLVAVVFFVPLDLLCGWLASNVLRVDSRLNLRSLLVIVPFIGSFQINLLGYSAIAWAVGEAIEGRAPSIVAAIGRFSTRRMLQIFATLIYEVWLIFWPILAMLCINGLAFAVLMSSVPLPRALGFAGVIFVVILDICFLAISIINGIDYCFAEFPAIFEGTFVRRAASRSKKLVNGRRLWIFVAINLVCVPLVVVSLSVTVGLPSVMGWPPEDFTSMAGVFRAACFSLINAILVANGIVFQTLLYFRLRREKHDLTFFDLSNTSILPPASEAAGISR